MRADFLRFYGLEPEDVPLADIWDMCASLPRGARTLAAIDPRTAWTDGEYMLAACVDLLGAIAAGLGGRRPPAPVPRPGGRAPHGGGSRARAQAARKAILATEWKEAPDVG